MERTLSFIVTIPEADLVDLARTTGASSLGDSMTMADLAEALSEAISDSLTDLLGDFDGPVQVRPMA